MRVESSEAIQPIYDVVVLNAHPDDVEMAVGGTLLKLVEGGKRVLSVIFTRGDAGRYGTVAERVAEAGRASEFGGYDYLFLNRPDCGLFFDRETRDEAVCILRRARPELVLAPYHTNFQGHRDGINHEDHLALGRIAAAALKISRVKGYLAEIEPWVPSRLLYFMVPRAATPSLIIDVSEQEERIRGLINCFTTQTQIIRSGKPILDVLLEWRRFTGYTVGVELGESFLSEEPLLFSQPSGLCQRILPLSP